MDNKLTQRSLRQPLLDKRAMMQVLLIEDEASYAGLVSVLLSANPEQDCETTIAATLAQGLEQLNGEKDFDAVLLDLSLPDSTGIDTLLRLIDAFPNTNVIVLTGTSDRDQGVRAVGAGAQDYLVKGEFEPPQLYRVLRFSIERKQILMRLEEAQQIARIGNWEFRPSDGFFFASKEVYRILGMNHGECTYTYNDIQSPDCPFYLLRAQEDHEPAQLAFQQDSPFQQKNGRTVHVLLNSRRVERNEQESYYVGTLQDITLQKRTEELQLAQQLSEETARVREQVIATVSHELRTPMNAIVGMSNLLIKTPLNKEQEEYVYSVQEASHLLLGIINDILLTSSLQNDALSMEGDSFDLPLTIRRIVDVLKPKALAKGLVLRYDLSPPLAHRVKGDKQRISQVLYNILGNAVKFTEQGQVDLQINWKEAPSGGINVQLIIQDTGPGIKEDQQAAIFQPFHRIYTTGKRQEGTGLGLSIAKQLIERMGGQISVSAKLGKGSKFTIDLPLQLETNPPSPGLSASTKQAAAQTRKVPKRILIVEDHPMNQIVLQKTLEQEWSDLEITIAPNGAQARQALENTSFDLILMDIQLPDEDGFSITRYLRTTLNDKHTTTPVLAMTAQTQIAEDERYLEAGMNDYVLKPFNPEELFEKIAQYVK
ncbi:hybrid sensor histidine kinase/response regulator [Lewinella cohaerens]|uniref:hybrid sensor histidine kinase/response regulator n=1 Tax=Lewinella cohaerens TaxID=70995 RepID=UPI00035FA459|nr:response regulator [Lewinella cohaerens]